MYMASPAKRKIGARMESAIPQQISSRSTITDQLFLRQPDLKSHLQNPAR